MSVHVNVILFIFLRCSFVRNKGGFRHGEETFFRGVIRDYPYVENVLIKNVVATLAKVKFVRELREDYQV